MDPNASLLGMPHESICRGCAHRTTRNQPEVIGFVSHSSVRQAPPYRRRLVSQTGASEVRRGASGECPGDRRTPEREAVHPGGIGCVRGPVRRGGVCARTHGGRAGTSSTQDESSPAGEGDGSGLRQKGPIERGWTLVPRRIPATPFRFSFRAVTYWPSRRG